MKHMSLILSLIAVSFMLLSCAASEPVITVEHDGDNALVHVDGKCRYLMLPVQESSWEVRVRMADAADDVPAVNIRLSADTIDHYVPFELPEGGGRKTVKFEGLWPGALCWTSIRGVDEIPPVCDEKFRPVYHHSPQTGWMNDPNGMFYKDGVYHLFYQHNPYGNKWGNMHWSHSSSRDLMTWEHHGIAIAPDSLGTIFSGSAVVDAENTSGFGKDAVIAFYTSHIHGVPQVQSMAYSTDGGMTFTKYEGNPVVESHDGILDFRDPKVLRYEDKWVMVVAANYEVRFYSSEDLKNWEYTGAFGKGYGPQPALFECPDLVRLPVDGDEDAGKWMLIVNVNPGGPFNSSACQYFIGEFDGRNFTCDTDPEVTKWLDYGKDHYAAVTFANTGDRAIAMAWMNAWPYAERTPTEQFRSINSIPRELGLFTVGDDVYAFARPSAEVYASRGKSTEYEDCIIGGASSCRIGTTGIGAYEAEFKLRQGSAGKVVMTLQNCQGENFSVTFDFENGEILADRSGSGLMTDVEEFVRIPAAPLYLCSGDDGYDIDVFVDRCSVEVFVDGGRLAMSNLVFPSVPFDMVCFESVGEASLENINVYEICR